MAFRSLMLALPIFGLAELGMAEDVLRPTITFDGSLPWQYASNPTRTSGTKHPDHEVSPYSKLSLSGRLSPQMSYQLYGSAGFDKYVQLSNQNGSVGSFGAQIRSEWERVNLGFNYERGLYYDDYFRGPAGIANDFASTARTSYSSLQDGFTVKTTLTAALRIDDAGVLQRTLLAAKIGFERAVSESWTAFLTPQVRRYEYHDLQNGRRDTIFSISSGLKYDVTKDISWTTSVGYEVRDSNVPTKQYVNYVLGTSLDFSFDLLGGRDGSNRISPGDVLKPSDRR